MSTVGKSIECSAFVCWGAGEEMKKETVTVAPPKAGEVRIKMVNVALCHTDVYTQSGADPQGLFPVILGHEGAGVVESVGEGVTSVAVGDHVIPCYIPECGECDYCKSSKTNLCQAIVSTQYAGLMPDGTRRFTTVKDGKEVELYHFMGISAFSEYTVVAEISVAKISEKADLSRACLLGCGVTTGHGAAVNTAKVEEGSTCGVWGCGAVGLAAIMGCKDAGAKKIVAVDINPAKEAVAREFGATDFFNPVEAAAAEEKKPEAERRSALQMAIDSSENNGFDYTFEAVGNVKIMRQALEAAHKGWGVSCIIGVAGAGQEIATRPFQLVTGRRWIGTAFGGYKSRTSVPRLVERYLLETGKNYGGLEKFVSHELKFDALNEAVHLLHAGDGIRSVMSFE